MAADVRPMPSVPHFSVEAGRPLGKVREQAEREHILSVLKLTDGRRGEAAQILGISRKTLWKKLKHMGLTWPLDVT